MSSAKRKKGDDSDSPSKRVCVEELGPTISALRACESPKAGIVKKVYMKNFMCHSSLEVNLHPKINFIVGRNGSGKSAILTALVVGLGGKASSTNRGSSLKEFIKKGMNTATLEVTLSNTGMYCYKPEEYGESIIVTRTLNAASGQSSYKLKAQNCTLISTKKEELDRIISALNIQVDNPVSVLNQDSARTFLNSSDPREKFALFMKATQLEKLFNSYRESLTDKHRASNIINSRKESLGEAQKEVNDLEHKWKTLQSLGDCRKKAEELENELYWSKVVTKEKEAEIKEQIFNDWLIKLAELERNVNIELECETVKRNSLKKIEEEIKAKRSMVTDFEKQYSEYKEEARRKRELYANKMKAHKLLVANSQRIHDNVATLQQAVENFESVSSSDQIEKRQMIRQEIRQLEERQADVQQTLKTKKQYFEQLSINIEKMVSDRNSLVQEKQEHTSKIDQRQQEIRYLKNESHSLTVFGLWAPQLAQKIDEAYKKGMFERMPRGPIGAYIKLKDASWASAIEGFLGALLKTYCVNSARDSQVLDMIFKEVLRGDKKPTIIASKFVDQVHNVQRFSVQSNEYSSILNMLLISDPVVANTLIDQREIESILLIPTDSEASRIMSEARLVPRNCKRAITKKGDQYYPDPNYRTYAGEGNMKAKLLQVSMEDAISSAEDDLRNHIFQRDEIDKQLKIVEQHMREKRTEINVVTRRMNELKNDDFNINSRLTELRDIEEPEPNNVAYLTAELKESTDAHEKAKEEELVAGAECQQLKKIYEESEMKVKELRDNYREIQNEERPSLNQKANIQSELKEILSKKNYWQAKYKEMCSKVTEDERKLSEQRDAVKNALEAASMICERIDTDRSPGAIEKELNDCRKYMESVEKHTGSLEVVRSSYIEKKTKYNQIINDLKVLEDSLTKLEMMINDRTRIITTIERLTSLRVQHMFQILMHSQKYMGELKIDRIKKTLDIHVCPSNVKERAMTDTKSLSGGERSSSTVSFFMSLWDTVEPPFYILDEFDVFMDKVNRHKIMGYLLAHARQKTNFQFVFLTPQDTCNIQSDPDIKIHRMEDPDRINS